MSFISSHQLFPLTSKIAKKFNLQNFNISIIFFAGHRPQDGVPDMTVISNIDEHGINRNLKVRYDRDSIYVS